MSDKNIEDLIASTQSVNMHLGLTLAATLHSNRELRSFLKKYVLSGKPVELGFLSEKLFHINMKSPLRQFINIALKEIDHIIDKWPYSMIKRGNLSPRAQLIHRHITKKLCPKQRLLSLKVWESIPF